MSLEMKDIAQLIEDQGKAWKEFQEANDARLKAIEAKGYAPADLVEKVEKINKDLTEIGKQMTEVEKKAGRPKATSKACYYWMFYLYPWALRHWAVLAL